jgi:hypothetical protein
MAGAGDEEHVGIVPSDQAVEMRVQEIQSRGGPPVAEQARLDVLRSQWFSQQWIRQQVDLSDREVVGRAPRRMDVRELVGRKRCRALFDGSGQFRAFVRMQGCEWLDCWLSMVRSDAAPRRAPLGTSLGTLP